MPQNTVITATVTLSNLDVNNYGAVVFRADLTGPVIAARGWGSADRHPF